MLGIVLVVGDTVVRKTDKIPCPAGIYILVRGQSEVCGRWDSTEFCGEI